MSGYSEEEKDLIIELYDELGELNRNFLDFYNGVKRPEGSVVVTNLDGTKTEPPSNSNLKNEFVKKGRYILGTLKRLSDITDELIYKDLTTDMFTFINEIDKLKKTDITNNLPLPSKIDLLLKQFYSHITDAIVSVNDLLNQSSRSQNTSHIPLKNVFALVPPNTYSQERFFKDDFADILEENKDITDNLRVGDLIVYVENSKIIYVGEATGLPAETERVAKTTPKLLEIPILQWIDLQKNLINYRDILIEEQIQNQGLITKINTLYVQKLPQYFGAIAAKLSAITNNNFIKESRRNAECNFKRTEKAFMTWTVAIIGIILINFLVQTICNDLTPLVRIMMGFSTISISLVLFWLAKYLNRRAHELFQLKEEYEHKSLVLNMFNIYAGHPLLEKDNKNEQFINNVTNMITSSPAKLLDKKGQCESTPIDDVEKIINMISKLKTIEK